MGLLYLTSLFSGTFPITLASLASGSARQSASLGYQTTGGDDVSLQLGLGIATPTSSGDKSIYIWFYASVDGTHYTDPCGTTDAAVTIGTNHNLYGPYTVAIPVGTNIYDVSIPSVAQYFGGILPPDWGIVVENQAGGALWGTEGDFVKYYVGILYGTIFP